MADLVPIEPDNDPKRARVLDNAMRVVLAYGYHRTTMDDIARAADMSRPALYLLFKNKADIYRAVATRMFQDSAQRIGDIMAGDGPLGDRLFRAIDGMMIQMMAAIHASPHGAELLDLKSQLAGGLVEHWHSTLAGTFGRAITAEAERLDVDLSARGLSAEILAELLLDGLEGMKSRASDVETQRTAARQMVRVLELVLQR